MNTNPLLAAGVVALSVLAFEMWFRITSLKDIERKKDEIEASRMPQPL